MPSEQRYRMVVTDIDGTLVDLQQKISERNKEMINAFQQQGGIVTLATGRVEEAAYPYAMELDIHHPVILYNGGKIVDFDTEQCYFEASLRQDVIDRCLQLIEDQPHDMIFYADRKIWVKEITQPIEEYMSKDRVQCHSWDTPDFLRQSDVNKILIIKENCNFYQIMEKLKPLMGVYCELVRSEPTYLEVLPRSVSKGQALKMLVNRLGIEMQEVIAIGDNLNDLEMIRTAGLGVAVGNAHPELKAHAQYIAKTHLEDAVAEVIQKYCLDKITR
ncbi:Cof-type HAD-IIB family hydrolase [Paenibacillus sp. LMG 31456]|uniref:Cof-type HAD-IIB family hydrolase n=1 Tax=Paenibacillus foliorum TaxID=2654974 RepID=A0A972GNZ7_9BACL|nr:Cof-type HAD-IIB family hydrolase [Paenibacillus foliorum]NOU91739.1 Cof-type HAD-IIB family hydrolase [Paenibacillus foliorum]